MSNENIVVSEVQEQNENNPPIKPRKLTDSYSIVPNAFIQNDKISGLSRIVGIYLSSLPQGWIPRPTQLQKHFNFGDSVWRKVSKELREFGYLRLQKGGNTSGGSCLEFDITGFSGTVEIQRSPIKKDVGREPLNPEQLNFNGHINYTSSTNKTVVIKTTTESCTRPRNELVTHSEVVVCFFEKLKELGVSESDARRYVKTYPAQKIQEKLQLLKNAKANNPAAWIKAALANDYPPPAKPLQSKELGQNEPVCHEEQMKKIEASDLAGWTERQERYKALINKDSGVDKFYNEKFAKIRK